MWSGGDNVVFNQLSSSTAVDMCGKIPYLRI